MQLTDEQKKAIITLGMPDDGSGVYTMSLEVIEELKTLGLVHQTPKRGVMPESLDFTDEGEKVYAELSSDKD